MKKIVLLAIVLGGLTAASTSRAGVSFGISVNDGYGYSGSYAAPGCGGGATYAQPSYGSGYYGYGGTYGYAPSYRYAPSYGYGQHQALHHELRDQHRAVHQELRDEHRAAHHELRDAHADGHYGYQR